MSAARSRSIRGTSRTAVVPSPSSSNRTNGNDNPAFSGSRSRPIPVITIGKVIRDRFTGLRHRLGATSIRYEERRAAVEEQVPELLPLGRRIDRNEDCTGAKRAHDRENRVDAILQMNRNAIAATHPERLKTGRDPIGRMFQLGVGQPMAPRDKSLRFGPSLGGRLEESINQQPGLPARPAFA